MLPPQGIFQSATWDLPELTSSTVVERIGAALAEIDSVNISLLRAFTLRGLRDAGDQLGFKRRWQQALQALQRSSDRRGTTERIARQRL